MAASEVTERKEELRAAMRRVRSAIPAEERARRGRRVAARLPTLPVLRRPRSVLVFYAFGSEIPTEPAVESLVRRGHTLLLPFLDEGGMEAAPYRPGDDLVATTYGPKEPGARVRVDPASVEVVVAPGLAFDPRGGRLGYGRGHYDAYLRRVGLHAARVGIAFREQLVEEVPIEARDELVDVVVTDDGIVECAPRRTATRQDGRG